MTSFIYTMGLYVARGAVLVLGGTAIWFSIRNVRDAMKLPEDYGRGMRTDDDYTPPRVACETASIGTGFLAVAYLPSHPGVPSRLTYIIDRYPTREACDAAVCKMVADGNARR
jgi:hypothetical protein